MSNPLQTKAMLAQLSIANDRNIDKDFAILAKAAGLDFGDEEKPQ